jgi:hypothetical protein
MGVPTESPDSERLLGLIWTPSGLALNAPCRLYCGDRWRAGTITATGETSALVATSAGLARCSDRRNLLNEEEARVFKNSRASWKRQRAAAHRSSEEGQSNSSLIGAKWIASSSSSEGLRTPAPVPSKGGPRQ